MKWQSLLCLALLLVPASIGQGYKPKAGFVPEAATAIKIGEAVVIP